MIKTILLLATLAVAALSHDTIELHGAGTTNPSKFFWQVQDLMMERAKVPMFLTYRAVGSTTGMEEFMGNYGTWEPLNDFGAGDIPMASSRYTNITTLGNREMVHVPFVTGAIAFFHSVPESDLAGSALDLDACLLAKIFCSEITTWDDPEILAANPGFSPPAGQTILMAHRTAGSSSTTGISEYLSTTCGASWTLNVGSKFDWNGGQGVEGSGGMSDWIEANQYAIGYIDAGHGHNLGLSEVAIRNADGRYLTSLEADIAATVESVPFPFPNNPSDDFSNINLYNLPGDDAWPVTMVTYLYLQKNMSSMDADKAAALRAFVEFILSVEGQDLAETYSFVKLGQSVLTYNENTLNNITWPSGAEWFTFETSTNAFAGAGEHVISVKRRSFAEYERENLNRDIEALQTDVASLTTTVEATASSCSCHDHDDAKNVAAAAIALAVVSLLVSVVAVCLGNRQSNKNNGMDKCTPSISKAGHVEMGTSNGNTI